MSQGKYSKQYMKIAKQLFKEYAVEEHLYCYRPVICSKFKSDDDGIVAYEGFKSVFKPDDKDSGDRWYDSHAAGLNADCLNKIEYHNQVRDHRVFSLLFMHEMAKDYEKLLKINSK